VLAVPAGTPSGEYRVEVGLYWATTGRRLPVVGTGEDRVTLGTVQYLAP